MFLDSWRMVSQVKYLCYAKSTGPCDLAQSGKNGSRFCYAYKRHHSIITKSIQRCIDSHRDYSSSRVSRPGTIEWQEELWREQAILSAQSSNARPLKST